MGKYDFNSEDYEYEVQRNICLENIANELAEANRLKRIELTHNLNFNVGDELREEINEDRAS